MERLYAKENYYTLLINNIKTFIDTYLCMGKVRSI